MPGPASTQHFSQAGTTATLPQGERTKTEVRNFFFFFYSLPKVKQVSTQHLTLL